MAEDIRIRMAEEALQDHRDDPGTLANAAMALSFLARRHDEALHAIERARQVLPELRVLAFGADQSTSEWPLPAGTRYVHRPVQSALSTLYASCNAWLFASRVDSFGLPILEAMACRTPVIGVPVGAAPDLLTDGCGILVGSSEGGVSEDQLVADLAAAIVNMCQQPASAWQFMSQCAYERAHSYSWSDASERLLKLLQEP
jgi:glycosyltransferase involved in cell wall biosynthesis